MANEAFTTHTCGEPWEVDEPETTVMLRKLPHDFTRDRLLTWLDTEGFGGNYDLVYLPCNLSTGS